jgi:hypothetical protein
MSRFRSFPYSDLKISVAQSLLLLAFFALLGLSGCGGGGGGTISQSIGVFVVASSTTVNGNGTVTLTATVVYDNSNSGATWSTPAIGSLNSLTSLTPTYTAPAATASAQQVTLTATSVADKSKSGSVTITINPLITAAVAGNVTFSSSCNSVIAGPPVSISINTTPTQSTTTGSNGNYSFASIPAGSYTVTPSIPGTNAIFSPATQSVTVGSGGAVASFNAAVGYSVSGTVSYTGNATGPINIALLESYTVNNVSYSCGPILGTSIAAPGPFTINGVPPGSYKVLAWRDALSNGKPNASDPTGSSTALTVSSGNQTGISVAMADPAAVTFSSVINSNLGVTPFDQGVILSPSIPFTYPSTGSFWQEMGDFTAELASSYTVQWSADSTFSTITGSATFPATGGNGSTWIVNGLTDGQPLYFRFQSVAGSVTSPWPQASGPVTINAPTGTVTVSGNVNFDFTAGGPLYVSYTSQTTNNTNKTYYTRIANPKSPQHYSIQLPAIGNYSFNAIIDQNNNNILGDDGDTLVWASQSDIYNLAITGSTTQDISLQGGGNSFAAWGTTNFQEVNSFGSTKQYYYHTLYSWDGSKKLEVVELTSGPNVVVPQDLSRNTYIPSFSFFNSFNLLPAPRRRSVMPMTSSSPIAMELPRL